MYLDKKILELQCTINLNISMKNEIGYFYIIGLLLLLGCNTSTVSKYDINNGQETIIQKNDKPKNIILMIGDGMGLGQISAAMYKNGGQLYLEEVKYIGLIKTNSASSIITDSAAGATAFATGQKTYNQSINMSIDSIPLKPITYTLHEEKIKTGIIATSSVHMQHLHVFMEINLIDTVYMKV